MTAIDEQETTITWLRSEDKVRIYTSNPTVTRQLRGREVVTQTRGDDTWGEFTVAISDFHPIKGFKRRSKPMTPEQRQAAADRLKKAREKRADS